MPIFWHSPFFLNLFLQGMAVFATPSWPSPISGLPHFPVRYPGGRCTSSTTKTKYLLLWNQFADMYTIRWLLMTRLLNGLPLPLQLVSSQSTPWRTSRESHKPTTRLPISNDPQLFPLSAHAALKTRERKRAKWNAGKTFVPLTPEYLPFIQNVWSHA